VADEARDEFDDREAGVDEHRDLCRANPALACVYHGTVKE
jgi:RecB family exonuclease